VTPRQKETEAMAEPKRLPNGRWQVRYRDPDGRPRSKVCDTKAQARAWVQDTGHAGRARKWVAPELGRITLSDWAGKYMSTVVHLRPTTVWLYQRELAHILKALGDCQLGRLEPLRIQAWLADLLADGMAPSSVHRKYRLLRRLLQVAVDKGVLVRNPCAGVEPPRVELNEMRFLTPGEVAALAEAIDAWFRPLVYTAAETGMRWSELIGLRRSGIDLLRRSISVTEQLVYIGGSTADGRAGGWVRQTPKTRAGTRSISVSPFLAEQLNEQLVSRSQPGRDGLVFVNMRSGPIGGSIFNKRHWQPARNSVGLDDLRFHDLRHTAVALAVAQGAHPKAIQRRLGHSTINMTLDRYGHLFPEFDQQVAHDVGAALGDAVAGRSLATVSRTAAHSLTVL
jgi:integrase